MNELPFEPNLAGEPQAEDVATPPLRPNLLLVDDNPHNLVALQGILRGLDANLATAGSGEEALRWLAGHDAAVILLDVFMPGLDGFETAKLLRLRPRSKTTPIIFVTAIAETELLRGTGYQLGAVDYLTKPLEADTVCAEGGGLYQAVPAETGAGAGDRRVHTGRGEDPQAQRGAGAARPGTHRSRSRPPTRNSRALPIPSRTTCGAPCGPSTASPRSS